MMYLIKDAEIDILVEFVEVPTLSKFISRP
jgi:hypothetical protein